MSKTITIVHKPAETAGELLDAYEKALPPKANAEALRAF